MAERGSTALTAEDLRTARPMTESSPALPPMRERSLIGAIDRGRAAHPDKLSVLFPSHGVNFSYADLWTDVAALAGGLRQLGLQPGDRVATMLKSSPEYLLTWFGCDYAGLISVSVNHGAAGRFLQTMLTTTSPRIAICDNESAANLAAVAEDIPSLEWIVNVEARTRVRTGTAHGLLFSDLSGAGIAPDPLDPTTTTAIRFTSGTTGPPKAVGLTESQMAVAGATVAWLGDLKAEDRLYTAFPMYHGMSSIMGVATLLRVGGSCAVDDRFHATDFWHRVYDSEATAIHMLRALLGILLIQPPGLHDSDHQVRRALWGPKNTEFSERFHLRLIETYSMSEGSMVCHTPAGVERPSGSCGVPTSLFDLKVVDENDIEAPPRTPGEIVLRPREPHTTMAGYFGNAPATVHAWRNLWYHTGDQGYFDDDGFLYVVGRMGDQIRRKGVNISAGTIESAAAEHPSVAMAAAVAVPSALTESEVKLCLLIEGEEPELDQFIEFLAVRLPKEMLPRYLEFRSSLPVTSTNKVQKHELRSEGNHGLTDTTIDIEALTKSKPRV